MSKARAASDVTVYVGDQVTGLNVSPQFDGYSKVVLNVSKTLYYEAGTDTGRTMTVTIPWGTQEMCNNILDQIRGYAYQPLEATGAILDPSAELGDGVTVKDTYTMIGSTKNTFGPMLRTDIVTPHETEINHEFPYKAPINREVDRQYANMRSELKIQADRITAEVEARIDEINRVNAILEVQAGEISAKVSKTGGSSSSFGWNMTDTEQVWKANNREIFRLDQNGAQVTGKITATTGKIGGFDILANYLSYNSQTWGGTNTTGSYIGPNGIQCGPWDGGFHVTNRGALYATSGNFSGTVHAGNISYGGNSGYFSGSGLSGSSVYGSKIANNAISYSLTSSGVQTSLNNADYAADAVDDIWEEIEYLMGDTLQARNISATGTLSGASIELAGSRLSTTSITYLTSTTGTTKTSRVVTWG